MKINILYWDNGDEQRLLNTKLSWKYLQEFAAYCVENGVLVEPFLFDYSEVQVLPDAIHIPYPKGVFKRSEKVNKSIQYHGEYDGFISICDSDVIIRKEDYPIMKYFIQTLKSDKYYVFGLDDVRSLTGIDFENQEIDFEVVQASPRNFDPDMGGLFMIHIDAFKAVGYFDERFTVWGGEDNEIAIRLNQGGFKKKRLPVMPLHLPHNHALTETDKEQYIQQVKFIEARVGNNAKVIHQQ